MNRSCKVIALLIICLYAKKITASAGRAGKRNLYGHQIWPNTDTGRHHPSCSSSATPSGQRQRRFLCDDIDLLSRPTPTAKSTILALRGGEQSSSMVLTSFAKNFPVCTAFLSCALNGLAADWIAQRSEAAGKRSAAQLQETVASVQNIRSGAAFVNTKNMTSHYQQYPGDEDHSVAPARALAAEPAPQTSAVSFDWDPKRALAFVLYGGCYQGIACHMFYNVLFLKWFGPNRVWTKVAVSQFIMAPLLTLPCAYVFKGMVFGNTAMRTLEDYWMGVTRNGLLFSFWKLWIPVQFLIFAVIPTHLRIPFSSFFSFLWTVILSRKTSNA